MKPSASQRHEVGRRVSGRFLAVNERAWRRLPASIRDTMAARRYGVWIHALVARQAHREMYLGTYFLRNRPALELISRIVRTTATPDPVKVAVLGCSIGVEVYSILWTLRRSCPDLTVSITAVDISPSAVQVGELGVYGDDALRIAGWPIFEGLTNAEREGMFDWSDGIARIKPCLRTDTAWQVGDAADSNLVDQLGMQDLVVANNFLCHMPTPIAHACLRNISCLLKPGAHLVVTGVDLDVRTSVALDLGWEPIPDLRSEIHDGDPHVRADWPWRWWGLEPLDTRRPNWEMRYTAVFRAPAR